MFEWLWDQAVSVVYVIGYVAAINPVYNAVLRSAKRRKVQNISTVAAGSAASVAALFWPFAVPFLVSNFMHAGRIWNSRDDLIDAEEKVANDHLAEASRRAALHQIEASAVSLDTETKAIESEVFKAKARSLAETADWDQLEKAYISARKGSVEERVLFEEMEKRDSYRAHRADSAKRYS